jgi:O-antigen/teichoic acid export membrane protein
MIRPEVRADLRRWAADGTPYILGGTIVASLGAYALQVIGGRALGAAAFDPVSALLTVHFLVFNVLLLPVEQFEIRRVTLRQGGGGGAVAGVVLSGAAAVAIFTFFARARYFAGDATYTLIAVVTVAANALAVLVRGRLGGMRRFRAYGLASAVVTVARVGMVVAFLRLAATGPSVGWALALAPFVAVAWLPVRRAEGRTALTGSGGRFLTGFVLASAASQVLLLLAPMAVGILSDEPGLMSVVFVTFQLFRLPIVMTQNLLARLLPPFTSFAAAGRDDLLRRWAQRFVVGALVLSPIAAVGGGLLGPPAVSLLFGAEFRPSWEVAALAAAGAVLAAASLLVGQVLVARGRTMLLAAAWAAGFAAAVAALVPPLGSAGVRVSLSFTVGEMAALAATVAASLSRGRRRAAGTS